MLRHACVLLAAIFHCVNVHAQWSSFRPIDINVIPEDQRNMNEQTVVKGKIVPKEIRVDWYEFSLEGNTNEVKDLYQYPVADPTFAPGDRIVRIRTKDVGTAEEIMRELRATPDIPLLTLSAFYSASCSMAGHFRTCVMAVDSGWSSIACLEELQA